MKAWVCGLALASCRLASAAGEPPRPAPADLSLEELLEIEVVAAASRREQPAGEAPSAVSILTAADIRQYGWRTLGELLRSLPGFYLTDDRNYTYLGVRGFSRPGDYNTRVLLLLDGLRLNDATYDQALIGRELPIDLEILERVEVIRGPSSAIYGTSAFFAVINLVTRQPGEKPSLRAEGQAGSFGTFGGRIEWAERLAGGPAVALQASILGSHGRSYSFPELDGEAAPGGRIEHADRERSRRLHGSLAWKGLRLETLWSERDKQVPTASYGTALGDDRLETTDSTLRLGLRQQLAVGREAELTSRLSFQRDRYSGRYPFDPDPAVPPVDDRSEGRSLTLDAALVASPGKRHKLVAGGELRWLFHLAQSTFDPALQQSLLDDHRAFTAWGLYLQDEWTIGRQLRLLGGLRRDESGGFGGSWSPRVAVVWDPRPSTTLKLLYGHAFRAPNAYELYYYSSGLAQSPAPSLKPESIHSLEALLEQGLGGNLHIAATLYHYRATRLIDLTSDPDDQLEFRNGGGIRATGLRIEVRGRWPRGVEGRASLVANRTREVATDERPSNSPALLARLNFSVPLAGERLRAGLELQLTGARRTLGGRETDPHLLANLTLRAPGLVSGLDAALSLYNLGGARMQHPASLEHSQDVIRDEGRALRLVLGRSF